MKRFADFVPTILVCLFLLSFTITGCVKTGLAKYETKSLDEKAIIEKLVAYQDTINSYKWDNLAPLFTANGTINSKPVNAWVASNKEALNQMRKYDCRMSINPPQTFNVTGDRALVKATRSMDCNSDNRMMLQFDLDKVGSEWKIVAANGKKL